MSFRRWYESSSEVARFFAMNVEKAAGALRAGPPSAVEGPAHHWLKTGDRQRRFDPPPGTGGRVVRRRFFGGVP